MMTVTKQDFLAVIRIFLKCERGVTAIEYAAIGGAMALALIAVANPLGEAVSGMFEAVTAGFP